MGATPDICPNCSERNAFNLDYCAVCGLRFHARGQGPKTTNPGTTPAKLKKIDPAALKVMKKKRALLTAFREGRISEEKLRKGLRDLGGSEEVERALDLKKFLEEQIKTFERMDLSGQRERDFPDPDTPQTDLPRDENGAPITDFRASAEDRDYFTKGHPFEVRSRSDGDTLFKRSGMDEGGAKSRDPVREKTPRTLSGTGPSAVNRRTVRSSGVDWDEDDDLEDEEWGEEEDEGEEDFEIDLDDELPLDKRPESKPMKRTLVDWLDDDEDEGWGKVSGRKRRDLK